ncbi:MAG: heavy metal response regulator transcription factor [Gammaproteobacteria bacterium]|nr:MAG: heavy metal response regulator transcription factor [Gammaproteobacteria bacterium]
MTDQQSHVLVIEDEPKVARSLEQGLREAGYSVDLATSGEQGLLRYFEHSPDIIVLDLNLPGRDGIEILGTFREHNSSFPVIILSARDTVEDRVQGLDTGADDYLVKPFAFAELLARIRVLLRREQSRQEAFVVADLELDSGLRKASRSGKRLNLTPKEYGILELLLRNVNQPVSRQTLARDIWQVQRATPLDNVIDVHVMRLRKKVDSDFEKKLIHTIRGIGFMLSASPEEFE